MDYRPVDDTHRNFSTGGFQGNHRTHMEANAVPATCAKCHPGSNIYTSSHRDGKIKVSSGINGSPSITKYRNITSAFSQSASPSLSSCTNVNCHFETDTPIWGSTPLTFTSPAVNDCNTCHGAPPNDRNHPYGTQKHATYYGTATTSCVKCHADHTAESNRFAHATSAGKRGLLVSFAAAPNNGFGKYTGSSISYPKYLPSQTPTRNGTCKSTYCHSPGTKASTPDLPNTTAQWGGSLTCKGCHKSDAASADSMATGSHSRHVNGASGMYTLNCVRCHADTVNSGMAIKNVGKHVNASVDITFDTTSTAVGGKYKGALAPTGVVPGTLPYGQCDNVYCHSNGQNNGGTGITYKSPIWKTPSSGACGTCHDVNNMSHVGGSASQIGTGSHAKHLSYNSIANEDMYKCAQCHNLSNVAYPITPLFGNSAGGSCTNACHSAKHVNHQIEVMIPTELGATPQYNGSPNPGAGYSTCSNVYCHSNGLASSPTYATPKWGDPTTAQCGSCHGANATTPPASARHLKHVGNSGGYMIACIRCHSLTVTSTADSTTYPTIASTIVHVNKFREVKFETLNPFGNYSSNNLSCNSTYCHSIGNTSVAAGSLPGIYNGNIYAKPKWTDAGPLTCNSCHGRSTSNGMPDYTNAGAPGSATANSHAKHVAGSSIVCVECHEKTTKNGATIRSTFPSKHVDGSTHDVFFNLSGNNKLGVYTNATKTCNNVRCHSNGRGTYQSAQWGTSDTCDYCHPISALGGSHAKHVSLTQSITYYTYTANRSTAEEYNFGCSNCHPLTAGASHASGNIVLDFRPSIAGVGTLRSKNSTAVTAYGPAGTADGGTTADSVSTTSVKCLNVYCHSNGYALNPAFATTPDWYGGTFSGDRCAACHGNSPNSTIAGSPAHYNLNFAGIGNAGGHVVGIHYDNIYKGASGLATPGELGTSSHGNPTTSTSLNCDNCHFTTVEARNNDKNTVCATCHNGANLRGDAVIASRVTHVNGQPDVVFDAIQVRSKAQLNAQSNYTTAFTRVVGYKISGAYDIAKTALDTATMWNSSTKTCSNVSCHFNKPVSWSNTGSAYKCLICHDRM